MSVDQNKAAVKRFNDEIWGKGNLAFANEYLAPNYIFHTGARDWKGAEGFKEMATNLKKGFPDYHSTMDRMVAEGDMVVAFYTLSGTFKGEWNNTKPTGKTFKTNSIILSRFENGKSVESWSYLNPLDWYKQLGIPVPQG